MRGLMLEWTRQAAIAREEALDELVRLHRTLISESTLEPVRFVRALLALRQASVQMVTRDFVLLGFGCC